MAYSLNYAQMPDFGATMARGEGMAQQRQMNALQMLAQQREMEQAQQSDNALQQYAPLLGSQDPAQRMAGIQGLLQSGQYGARLALPLLQQERENAWMTDAPPGAPQASAPARAGAITLPSGQPRTMAGADDLDYAVRTVIGEAANQGPEGWRAVAGVIRNRAGNGASIRDVVLAPGQFEPWQTRRAALEGIDRNSDLYKRVRAEIAPIFSGEAPDPTNGATHFLNADIVRQRTGGTLPAWAQGEGQQIGAHTFYRPGGAIRTGAPAEASMAIPVAAPAESGLPNVPGFDPVMVQRAIRAAAGGNPRAQGFLDTYWKGVAAMARDNQLRHIDIGEGAPDGPGRYAVENGQIGRRLGSIPPPQTQTVINTGARETDKLIADAWNGLETAVQQQGRTNIALQRAEEAMTKFDPGALADKRIWLGQLAREFGIRGNVSEGEALRQVQRTLELASVPRGQGAVSDSERALFRESIPLLLSTPEGARSAISFLRRLNEYDAQIAGIYRRNAARHGGSPDAVTVRQEVADFVSSNAPPDARAELGQFMGEGGATPGAPTPAPPTPNVGTVQDGYRFKGGNPADPASWERVR